MQIIQLDNVLAIPEIYFQPAPWSSNPSLPDIILQCVNSCPKIIQELLRKQLILCGGSAKFPNMKRRIDAEMTRRGCAFDDVTVRSEHEWKEPEVFVSREEFDMYGPSIVHEKFF